VAGRQVHDAHLAATMLTYGVTRILTFNDADFHRYPDIHAIHPASTAAGNRPEPLVSAAPPVGNA